MRANSISAIVALCLVAVLDAGAQPVSPPEGSDYRNNLPVEPFRIIDNIYFVGPSQHQVSYLLTTAEGNILIDTVFERSVPQILANVKKLGFKQEDIKLILTVHAHIDHVGGHALMQEATGGLILASAEDGRAIESGGKSDPSTANPWTPAKVDRLIKDGEKITLGDTVLTAHLTPGHSQGCTTWTMVAEEAGQKYNVVFLCGVRIVGDSLLSDPGYPDLATDLAGTYKTLQSLPVDIYLGGHGYWFDLGGKIERMKKGEGYKAFIDPQGYRNAIIGWQYEFVDRLIKEAMAKK